jgi:hypothetical protein
MCSRTAHTPLCARHSLAPSAPHPLPLLLGEDGESIRPTVNRLRSQGIGSILDYAAEQDVQTRDDISVRGWRAALWLQMRGCGVGRGVRVTLAHPSPPYLSTRPPPTRPPLSLPSRHPYFGAWSPSFVFPLLAR